MLYIGIDGGGTKTQFDLFNQTGILIDEVQLPSCHILQKPQDEVIAILKQGIQTLIAKHPQEEVCICAGLAGYGKNIQMRKKIEDICKSAFAPFSYVIRNDSQIAHAGALAGNDGILIIAGTGSIGLAMHEGEELRCGGWGYMLDDGGSAYAIAKSLLSHYCRQCDGREPRTNLVDKLNQTYAFEDEYAVIPFVANVLENKREKIADLAKLVYELAQEEDKAAFEIYRETGIALAELANELAKSFHGDVLLSYIGGVWKSTTYIMMPFLEHLNESISVIPPIHSASYGAYLIAKKHYEESSA